MPDENLTVKAHWAEGDNPTIKATVKKNTVTLKWSAVDGTTDYTIYLYKNKKWIIQKTVKANTVTFKKLANNKKYNYLVRAMIDGNYNTLYNVTVSVCYQPVLKAKV